MNIHKIFFLIIFFAILSKNSSASNSKSLSQFTFYAGDKKASYFAVAKGICNVFNQHFANQGFECIAKESKGSEANLKFLASGEADLAIVKTLDFNKFFIKNAEFLQNKTQFVAKIYDENLTILAPKKLTIKKLSDLNKKIVNIGSIGSSSALIVEKYFSKYGIKPKKIVNLSASQSFEKLCNDKIDVWVYFIGHPNDGYREALQKCDLEIVSLFDSDINNFLNIASFIKQATIDAKTYPQLHENIKTVSTNTIIASRLNFNSQIIALIQNILNHHKPELIKENQIFSSF